MPLSAIVGNQYSGVRSQPKVVRVVTILFRLVAPDSDSFSSFLFIPIGKRIEVGVFDVDNGLAQRAPPQVERLDQPRKLARLGFTPSRGNSLRTVFQLTGVRFSMRERNGSNESSPLTLS